MTFQEKEELLYDLCERLPFQVMCKLPNRDEPAILMNILTDESTGVNTFSFRGIYHKFYYIEEIKPYLKNLQNIYPRDRKRLESDGIFFVNSYGRLESKDSIYEHDLVNATHFLRSRGYDYKDFIQRGLALDESELCKKL